MTSSSTLFLIDKTTTDAVTPLPNQPHSIPIDDDTNDDNIHMVAALTQIDDIDLVQDEHHIQTLQKNRK